MVEISGVSSGTASPDQVSLNNGNVTRSDFLKLLIAQLEHQNPLNPSDGTDFAAQLAQFSQLEAMLNMNERLDALKNLQSTGLNALAVGYIGKTVDAGAAAIAVRGGQPSSINYTLGSSASSVGVNIFNDRGLLVRQLNFANQAAGDQTVQFDGRNSNGSQLPDGVYTYTVGALNEAGFPVAVNTYLRGSVTGVELGDGGLLNLIVNNVPVGLNEITRVSAP